LVDVGYKGIFVLFSLFCATLLSGCVTNSEGGTDVTALASSLPQVKEFLDQYPNAKVSVALWDSTTVEKNIAAIRADCGEQFAAGDYYKVSVVDPSFSLVVWLDKSSQNVMCAVKAASSANPTYVPTGNPTQLPGSTVVPAASAIPTVSTEFPPMPPGSEGNASEELSYENACTMNGGWWNTCASPCEGREDAMCAQVCVAKCVYPNSTVTPTPASGSCVAVGRSIPVVANPPKCCEGLVLNASAVPAGVDGISGYCTYPIPQVAEGCKWVGIECSHKGAYWTGKPIECNLKSEGTIGMGPSGNVGGAYLPESYTSEEWGTCFTPRAMCYCGNVATPTPTATPTPVKDYAVSTYVNDYLDNNSESFKGYTGVYGGDSTGFEQALKLDASRISFLALPDNGKVANPRNLPVYQSQAIYAGAYTNYDSSLKTVVASKLRAAYTLSFSQPLPVCWDVSKDVLSCPANDRLAFTHTKIKLLGQDWLVYGYGFTSDNHGVMSILVGKETAYNPFMAIDDILVAPNGAKVRLISIYNNVSNAQASFEVTGPTGFTSIETLYSYGGVKDVAGITLRLTSVFSGINGLNYADVSIISDKMTLTNGALIDTTTHNYWSASIGSAMYGSSPAIVNITLYSAYPYVNTDDRWKAGEKLSLIRGAEGFDIVFNGMIGGYGYNDSNARATYTIRPAAVTLTPSPSPTPVPVVVSCNDSDGGLNYYQSSYVRILYSNSTARYVSDFCSQADSQVVFDMYCNGTTAYASQGYVCPNGCSDGACVNATPSVYPTPASGTIVSCTDSDSGLNFDQLGYVRVLYSNGTARYVSDFCSQADSQVVFDMYCNGTTAYASQGYVCPNGCSNGVCVASIDASRAANYSLHLSALVAGNTFGFNRTISNFSIESNGGGYVSSIPYGGCQIANERFTLGAGFSDDTFASVFGSFVDASLKTQPKEAYADFPSFTADPSCNVPMNYSGVDLTVACRTADCFIGGDVNTRSMDFAAVFRFYLLHGPEFRALVAAKGSTSVIAQKYAWMKENVFAGKEFSCTDLMSC